MHRSICLTACSLAILVPTGALIPAAFAQSSKIVQTEIRLEPSPLLPPFHDQFGLVVAVSANGNTLAINAATEDNGPISEVGAIFIFDRINNQWVQTARLFPNDGVDDEQLGTLGTSLSEDGNTVVAGPLIHSGAFNHEGAVYVFHRTNGAWIQEAELLSPTPGNNQLFGTWGVSISGNVIAAGDQGGLANGFTPGVDVFTRVNGQWGLSTTIQMPDDPDFSPSSVTIRGSTMVVANSNGGLNTGGVVFVFGLVNGSWVLQAKLAPSDLTIGSQFGTITAIDGNMLAVGAPGAPGATAFSGAVYLFTKRDKGWAQTAKLAASDGVGFDTYGLGLDLNSGIVVVGAPSHNLGAGNGSGAVYLYQFEDGKTTQLAEFAGSDIGPGGNFGLSVSLRAGILLVGGPGQHPQPNNNPFYPEGEAYIYRIDH